MPRTLEDYRQDLSGFDVEDDLLAEVVKGIKSPSDPEIQPAKSTKDPRLDDLRNSLAGFDVEDDLLVEIAGNPGKPRVQDDRNPLDLLNLPEVKNRLAPGARALMNVMQMGFPQISGPLKLKSTEALEERIARDVGAGVLGMGEDGLSMAQSILDADNEVGQMAGRGANILAKTAAKIAPTDPDLFDKTVQGLTSMAVFAPFGLGAGAAAKGATTIGNLTKVPKIATFVTRLAPAIGVGVMTLLESGFEQGGTYKEALNSGMPEPEARKAAHDTFWKNVLTIGLSNTFSAGVASKLGTSPKEVTRMISEGIQVGSEGFQEGVQSIITDTSLKRPINWKQVAESALIGTISAGLVKSIGDVSAATPLRTTTVDANVLGGPEGTQQFKAEMPVLAEAILGKDFPVGPEVLQEGIGKAGIAVKAAREAGMEPADAQLSGIEAFLGHLELIMKGEPVPVKPVPEEEITSPPQGMEKGRKLKLVDAAFDEIEPLIPEESVESKPKPTTPPKKPPEQAPAEEIQAAAASLGVQPHELTYDQFKRVYANDIKGMPEEEVRADYRQTIMAAIKEGKDVPESIIQGLQQKVGASDLSPLAGAPATPTIETKPKKVRLDARGIPLLKPNAVVLKLELDNKQTATLTHKVALEHAKSLMKETLDRWEDLKANDLISKIGKIRWTDDLENLGDLSGKVIPGWLRARIFTKDPSSPLLDEKAQDLGISEADLIKQIVDYPKTLKKAPSRNLADYYQEAIHEWEYYTLHPQAHQAMDKSARYDAILGNQRANEGMQAAVKDPKTGELLTGPSHSAIIRDVIKNDLESADRITAEILNQTENVGFVDQDFEFITRQQAERRFGILNSESLPKGGTLRQPAYHGSPYRFDRFSVQKIGTGEGHQTFGWGLYFAGKKDVAEYYRKTLTPDREIPANVRMAFSRLDNLGFDSFFEALSNVEANPKDWKEMWDVDPLRDPKEMMDAHIIDEFIKQPKQKGHVYEVDIPEDGDYLNWDKPLSEQPHVLSALNKLPAEVKALVTKNFASVSNWTGEEFYKGLADAIVPSEDKNFGGHVTDYEGASKQLLNVGIPGLRYLDQGSRITGEGTYNYVLFDDSLVKITKVSESPTLDVSNEVNGEPIGKVRSATEFKRKEVDIAFKQKPPEPGSPDFFIGQPGPREIYQSSFAVKYQKTGSLFIPNQKIYSPQDIAFAFRYLHNEAVENFLIGAVKNGKIVGIEHIATGRIDQVSVDFFDTIHLLDHVEADGYFMVHNHPSGFPEPSLDDIDLTKAARTILDRSGYKLLGHVVIDDTTFGFIDPDLKVRQWKHQEYAKTKEVPLLKKYLEWSHRKVDPRHAPSIPSPQAVFEVAKGIQVGMDEGVVFLLNTHNRIINALIVPKSQMNTGDLQRLAGRYRGNRIILANSSIPNFQLPVVQRDLRSAGISLLDDVLSTDTGYRSAVETGILGEEPVKYQTGLELSDQPGTYIAKEKLEDEYAKARNVKDPTIKDTTKQFLDEKKSSIREFGESLGLVISDRLADIDPSLKIALRKFESDYRQAIKRDLERVRPFMQGLDKIAKLNKTDALIMDLAMKNGDAGMQTQMAMKYGILDELMKARVLLEEIRPRIQSVGYQVGYRTGYFPRKIRDRKGFIKYMEKQGELWGEIDQAIREKEESLKRELNEEEKVNLINSFIRGFTRSKVALAHTGNMKTREIEMLTVAINKFYYSGRESLARYISEVNEAIEARKFFGRVEVNPKLDAPSQMVMEEMTPKEKTESALSFNNIQDSIGAFVNRLLEAGKITPTQQEELRDIFQARFGYIGSHGILGLYKNITYMNTITSVISGLSNLDDVGVSLYKATWQTPGSFIRAIANRSKIKLEELGLEAMNEEIREASKSAALLRMMLRPLFTPFDRIGKETTLNAVIDRYRSIAKGGHATFDERFNSLFGAKGDRFEDKLVDIFGAEADNVLEDLKEGRITENILFLAFNELSEIQPISLSEVPQVYLESPGGRLFYTLKTFMVKRLNFLRAEVHNAKDKKEAIIQMMKMLGWMIAAGIGVDELKDFILNRKTSWSDRIIDNVLRPIGISKYLLYRIREDGAQAVLGYFLLPPTPLIDGIWRDIRFAGKPVKTGPNRKEPRMYEFTRSIPMFGKEYYWWFGRGAQKTREQEFKRAQKARKNRL